MNYTDFKKCSIGKFICIYSLLKETEYIKVLINLKPT